MSVTPNMKLTLATVEETLGPLWASLINEAFEKIDSHNHSTNNGSKVTPDGLLINSALNFLDNQAQRLASAGLSSKGSADTSHFGSLQRIGTNLYWVNGSGAAVQITDGANIKVPQGSGKFSAYAPSTYPYDVQTTDSEAVLLVDTSAARTLNLPSAANAMYVIIKDANQNAQDNPITILPDGSDVIAGENEAYVLDYNDGSVGLISDGVSAWHII